MPPGRARREPHPLGESAAKLLISREIRGRRVRRRETIQQELQELIFFDPDRTRFLAKAASRE